MNVLSVASEMFPLVKTGGLADVVGALPKALRVHGVTVTTLLPGYTQILEALPHRAERGHLEDLLGYSGAVTSARVHDVEILVLEIPELFERDGGPYLDANGRDHVDNWLRFAAFSLAGARVAAGQLPGYRPELAHVHDWQTGLVPVYLRHSLACSLPVVCTIHNLAFQGKFASEVGPSLRLPRSAFGIECLEYYGSLSYLKGGIQCADIVTTVSPTYAREILSPEMGMGLEGVLQSRRVSLYGIVNGIDSDIWNPATDAYIPATYADDSLERRAANRATLMNSFGLRDRGGPVFAALSRLTWQKGADMLSNIAGEIVAQGGQLIVCGQGDRPIEQALEECAARHPNDIGLHIGYNENLAHLIVSGCDVLMQPSRFEPCGLTQLYAMRYGAIPLVGRTGGLSETIIDANEAAMAQEVATGFQFHPIDDHNFSEGVRRACDAFKDTDSWHHLQCQAMKADFSWHRSAGQYAQLFRALRTAWHKAAKL